MDWLLKAVHLRRENANTEVDPFDRVAHNLLALLLLIIVIGVIMGIGSYRNSQKLDAVLRTQREHERRLELLHSHEGG